MKRGFDILLALAGLLLLSPVLALLAAPIRLGSPGPVFYRGKRVGHYGKPFRIFKFRTMVVDAEKRGGMSTADGDPRVTRIGSFLRKYKLDELPQLINVFSGDMSLVGPRPEVQYYVDLFNDEEKAILSGAPRHPFGGGASCPFPSKRPWGNRFDYSVLARRLSGMS